MEQETAEMRFCHKSEIETKTGLDEPAETLKELQAYMDEYVSSYTALRAKITEANKKWTKTIVSTNGATKDVIDHDAWEREDPDSFLTMGLAEHNAFNGLDLLDEEIKAKKEHIARRKRMHTELFFYESDSQENVFVLNDHLDIGYGVYVSQNIENEDRHNYMLEVPEMTDANHIDYDQPIHKTIIDALSSRLGHSISENVCANGKLLREYLAQKFGGVGTLSGEKSAAELLSSVGISYISMQGHRFVLDSNIIKVINTL